MNTHMTVTHATTLLSVTVCDVLIMTTTLKHNTHIQRTKYIHSMGMHQSMPSTFTEHPLIGQMAPKPISTSSLLPPP